MPASDERSRHGNVLDDVLREEIKDLTPEQVKRVLEYIETLKQQWQRGEVSLREAGRRLSVTHQTFKKWVEEPEED